jgi:DHA3 family tetracycline resistance protein-like MFS transporter
MHFRSSKLNAFAIYLLISGLGSFAFTSIATINLMYQIETVKLNPLQLVLVGTTLETVCFISQIPTGVLADTYSRRNSVVIGYLLMGIGFLVEGLMPHFLTILLAQILWGCGSTCVSGAQEAWCADEIGEEHVGHVFMRGAQLGQIASLLSIPVSIWLAISYRLNIPILLGASLFVLLALLLFGYMPEQQFQPVPRAERGPRQSLVTTLVAGGKAVKQSRMLQIILWITVFSAMASEGFDRLGIDHFIQDVTFPTLLHLNQLIWFGVINAGSFILCLGCTEIVRRTVKTDNQPLMMRVMFAFQILLIGSLIVFSLADNFTLALIAFWCTTIGRRAVAPLQTIWITQNSDPRRRATIISMFGQVDAMGQIAGGPAVGYIGTLVSLRAALLTTSAILMPSLVFFAQALRLSRKVPIDKDALKDALEV